MEFISLKTALAEYHSNTFSKDEISEDNILQWAADCLELIGNYRQYANNLTVLEVKDYKARLPLDFIAAELLLYQASTECNETALALTEIVSTIDSNCKVTCKDCCGQGLVETDAQPYLSQNYPWFGYSKVVLTSNMFDNKKFPYLKPMKLNDKSAARYHLNDCVNLRNDDITDHVDYTIRDGKIITTKKTGNIILFYLGQVVDEDGYPKIPNVIEYINAINYYVMYKLAWAEYSADKTQTSRLYFLDAKKMSSDAIARCITVMNTPTWEEFKVISEQWRSRIPQVNLYGSNISYNKARSLYARN